MSRIGSEAGPLSRISCQALTQSLLDGTTCSVLPLTEATRRDRAIPENPFALNLSPTIEDEGTPASCISTPYQCPPYGSRCQECHDSGAMSFDSFSTKVFRSALRDPHLYRNAIRIAAALNRSPSPLARNAAKRQEIQKITSRVKTVRPAKPCKLQSALTSSVEQCPAFRPIRPSFRLSGAASWISQTAKRAR